MKYETIKTQKEKDIFTITLNRPDVHNAMNVKLMQELTSCFKKVSGDKAVRIIILTGNGASFCAGADLNWMKSMVNYSKDENIKDSKLLLSLYESIYYCPKPVIGKVNGHAFGGGIGLFAVCDIVFAIPDCKFAFSEVKLGLIPSVISTFIAKRLNPSTMRRLFITGERFNSDNAKDIGLIDYVVSQKEINSEIQRYSEFLRNSGPNAVKEVKSLIDSLEKNDLEKHKEYTVKKIAELRVSKEGQEGINAFLEKRKSKWSE